MAYELWEMESGNCVGEFATEAEALAAIREIERLNNGQYVETFSLARTNRRGDTCVVAQGEALLERARAADVAIADG